MHGCKIRNVKNLSSDERENHRLRIDIVIERYHTSDRVITFLEIVS
jgi:hypothetical protein